MEQPRFNTNLSRVKQFLSSLHHAFIFIPQPFIQAEIRGAEGLGLLVILNKRSELDNNVRLMGASRRQAGKNLSARALPF